jgi:hypothetical protein
MSAGEGAEMGGDFYDLVGACERNARELQRRRGLGALSTLHPAPGEVVGGREP